METTTCRNCGLPIRRVGRSVLALYCHVGLTGDYGPTECQGADRRYGPFAEPAGIAS